MSSIACIIKCGGIYFSNGKFGVTWRLVQAVVKPKQTIRSILGKCQISLSSNEATKFEEQSDEDETMVDDDGVESTADNETPEQPVITHQPEAVAASAPSPKVEEAPLKSKPKRKVVRRARKPAA